MGAMTFLINFILCTVYSANLIHIAHFSLRCIVSQYIRVNGMYNIYFETCTMVQKSFHLVCQLTAIKRIFLWKCFSIYPFSLCFSLLSLSWPSTFYTEWSIWYKKRHWRDGGNWGLKWQWPNGGEEEVLWKWQRVGRTKGGK